MVRENVSQETKKEEKRSKPLRVRGGRGGGGGGGGGGSCGGSWEQWSACHMSVCKPVTPMTAPQLGESLQGDAERERAREICVRECVCA